MHLISRKILTLLLAGGLLLLAFQPLKGQNDYTQLKERYIGFEAESGYIIHEPAHSIGIGIGIIRDEHFQTGLTLHFLLNNSTHELSSGREELEKLNLLGLDMQYRNRFSKRSGYLAAVSVNIGSSVYNRTINDRTTSYTGFTMAAKPRVGLFRQMNNRLRAYIAVKYLHGIIFRGTQQLQGIPLLSAGIRFTEIDF